MWRTVHHHGSNPHPGQDWDNPEPPVGRQFGESPSVRRAWPGAKAQNQGHTGLVMSSLELTLIYLLAAVLGVVTCRKLLLPPMLGYLVVGVVIGPNALALAQNSEGIRHLGEFGVVFLMFVIGLEFNLPKLRSMRTLVFGLGLSQVLLTILGALTGNALAALIFGWAGHRWGQNETGRNARPVSF